MALLSEQGLTNIKTILLNFGKLSGLKCNVDKSALMIVGTDNVPHFAAISGFDIVNEIKILGVSVTKNYEDLSNNYNNKTEIKLTNISNFWKRFNLSLIGRINIAKTLMLSQIGYLGP
jgi:hypothetical protein